MAPSYGLWDDYIRYDLWVHSLWLKCKFQLLTAWLFTLANFWHPIITDLVNIACILGFNNQRLLHQRNVKFSPHDCEVNLNWYEFYRRSNLPRIFWWQIYSLLLPTHTSCHCPWHHVMNAVWHRRWVTVNPLQVSSNTGREMGVMDTCYAMWIEGRHFLSVHSCNGTYWSEPIYVTSTVGWLLDMIF